MQVITLDGLLYKLNTQSNPRANASLLHQNIISIIRECYPALTICEEVPIRVYRFQVLYLDILLPTHLTAIEVHGEQHYKFNKFFHTDVHAFANAQKRDKVKREWCIKNSIRLLELTHEQSRDEWRYTITRAIESTFRSI